MPTKLNWKWLLVAPLLGGLLTCAFAPYGYSYGAILALMFLYYSWRHFKLKQAMVVGYLFGLGLFGTGIWWVYISVHDFGGADEVSAGLLTGLLVALWAVFPALTAALVVKSMHNHSASLRILLAAILWVAVEYFRGYYLLNGFPWLQIAYSQLRTPLAGYAPILGVYGVGFLLAVSAFTLVEAAMVQLKPVVALLILLGCWGGGALLKQVAWTHSIGAEIPVTLVQGNIHQEQKWLPEQRINTLHLYQTLTEQHWQDSKLIIWPETAIPAFYSQVKEFFLMPLSATALEHQVDLVVSLPSSGAGKAYYNSAMVLAHPEQFYHKSHLLPFGEYFPLQPLSGWILDKLNIPLGDFTAGAERQTLLHAGGYAFIATICYEDAFGEEVSRQLDEAAFIVNLTNDAWFGNSSEPYQHMQMAQMRALENGRYLLRATNTGLTGIIAPDGHITEQAPLFTTTTLTGNIVPMAGLTPYARIGDKGVFVLLGVLLVLGYLARLAYKARSA
jgi:apolipoprotein N-acyltransferase